jgi:hypothetical protein
MNRVDPHQPVLVAAAVMLKVRLPADEDEIDFLARWGGTCRGVKGIFFSGEHCRNVQSNAKEIHNAYRAEQALAGDAFEATRA